MLFFWKKTLGHIAIMPDTGGTRYLGKGLSGPTLEKQYNHFSTVTPEFMCAVPRAAPLPQSHHQMWTGMKFVLSSPFCSWWTEVKQWWEALFFFFLPGRIESICVGRTLSFKLKRGILKFFLTHFILKWKKKRFLEVLQIRCVEETWYSLGRCHRSVQHLEIAKAHTKLNVCHTEHVPTQRLAWFTLTASEKFQLCSKMAK